MRAIGLGGGKEVLVSGCLLTPELVSALLTMTWQEVLVSALLTMTWQEVL